MGCFPLSAPIFCSIHSDSACPLWGMLDLNPGPDIHFHLQILTYNHSGLAELCQPGNVCMLYGVLTYEYICMHYIEKNLRPWVWQCNRQATEIVLLFEKSQWQNFCHALTANLRKSGEATLSFKKGQCHKIFDKFVLLNRFHLGPIWTGRNGLANFFVFHDDIL